MAEINLLRHYSRDKRKMEKPRSLDPANREAALMFGAEYFDGRREQGYGGYRYDGRWIPIARDIVAHFGLKSGDRVLDVGCAKGFLAKDLMAVCPGLRVYGLDISGYAIRHGEPEVRGCCVVETADRLPFPDGVFDVVLSINTLHNFYSESVEERWPFVPDPAEALAIAWVPIEDSVTLVLEQKIIDCLTVSAVLAYRCHLARR